jgi:hypothetical protein
VSMLPTINPHTAAFRDFSPGPHAGVETDAQVAPGEIDAHARKALTLGLLSLLLSVVTGIPAIWVGTKALRRINLTGGTLRDRWAAWPASRSAA